MPDQTEQDFRDIERDREIDTESGERPDDWADPELWNDDDDESEGPTGLAAHYSMRFA